MSESAKQRAEGLSKGIPVFRVKDVPVAQAYYENVLGFHVNWTAGEFASVARGECTIFLCADEQGHLGTWAYVLADDVDALFAEWLGKGAKVRMTPQNFIWGYEAHIADPDGNVLRIGQDRHDLPVAGIWVRDDGSRWQQMPDGGWERAS